jgi:chromosome segregation ATPase
MRKEEIVMRAESEIVRKVHVNDVPAARTVSASALATAETAADAPWWEWVDQRIAAAIEGERGFWRDVMAQVIAEERGALRKAREEFERELDLLRREFVVLREEVAVERKLRDLRSEVEEARAEVPKFPAVAADLQKEQRRLESSQARLRQKLEKTNERLSELRIDQAVAGSNFEKLYKEMRARTSEIEFEISTSRFAMRDVHPAAASALREFANQAVADSDRLLVVLQSLEAGEI